MYLSPIRITVPEIIIHEEWEFENLHVRPQNRQSNLELFPTKLYQKCSQRGFAFGARGKQSDRSLVSTG